MGWTAWKRVEGLTFQDIVYEKKYLDSGGGAARITINRPEVLNAYRGQTFKEMAAAFEDASNDPDIGVVVLTGTGDQAFSAGGDVRWESTADFHDTFREGEANNMLWKCRKPVIAAVKGYAVGAGNHIAYCCDFTIAAENAIFAQNGPRVGSPAHGWLVSYLARVVGEKRAREIWMTCWRYSAEEAYHMGLVNRVVPLDRVEAEVDRWCEQLLSLSPSCIQLLKATFDSEIQLLRQVAPFGPLLRQVVPHFMDSEERREGYQSFLEKRKPNFWAKLKPVKEAVAARLGWRAVAPGQEVFSR